MGYPYDIGEHDIPPGVTVCYVKDCRTGEIVRDGLHIDLAESIAESIAETMNEEEALLEAEALDDDEDD